MTGPEFELYVALQRIFGFYPARLEGRAIGGGRASSTADDLGGKRATKHRVFFTDNLVPQS